MRSSRSGKTVTALRLIAEMANHIRRGLNKRDQELLQRPQRRLA